MTSTCDLKPWFREDIARILMGVYVASSVNQSREARSESFHHGFTMALASVAVIVGIQPESFLNESDFDWIRDDSSRFVEI